MDEQTPDSPAARSASVLLSLARSWCDGLWLCIGFGLAGLAVAIPLAVLTRSDKAAGGSLVLRYIGSAVAIIAGPVILSRAFRELDYSGSQPHAKGQASQGRG
ncbi:MAG: hypothetical protein WKF75_08630 [Singulisphaera sp.]